MDNLVSDSMSGYRTGYNSGYTAVDFYPVSAIFRLISFFNTHFYFSQNLKTERRTGSHAILFYFSHFHFFDFFTGRKFLESLNAGFFYCRCYTYNIVRQLPRFSRQRITNFFQSLVIETGLKTVYRFTSDTPGKQNFLFILLQSKFYFFLECQQ